MHKITRIAYNSKNWRMPTGEARKSEARGTYSREHGFGHEDWLFRSDWLISGWRYAFLQGVNKGHAALLKAGEPLDLTLFTIEPDKKRRFVANIYALECLDDQQADEALKEFKRVGWYETMQAEIQAVAGNVDSLGDAKWAKHVLNVRFRLSNVVPFPSNSYAEGGDLVHKLKRYQLYDFPTPDSTVGDRLSRARTGSTSLPIVKSSLRSASPAVECTPEHARMQMKLMLELQAEHPGCAIERERDFVDISVRTATELVLFEIKSDLEPRTVIRQALGQILEYAFHPSRRHTLPVRLVIVGRRTLSAADEQYLERLRTDYNLPVTYRVVSL